jgi:hypothetical protein
MPRDQLLLPLRFAAQFPLEGLCSLHEGLIVCQIGVPEHLPLLDLDIRLQMRLVFENQASLAISDKIY